MCPRCQTGEIHSNGAFWVCGACGLAITGRALIADQGEAPDTDRRPAGHPRPIVADPGGDGDREATGT